MNPFLRLCTSLTVMLAGFVLWGGVSAPTALALPGAGFAKDMPITPLADTSVVADHDKLEGLVKKVGLRLRITYGGYRYPGGIYRYGRHRHYYRGRYKYRRYSPSYRYRSYRRYRASPRRYRTRRYGRRHLRRNRHLRRLRRHFRRLRY